MERNTERRQTSFAERMSLKLFDNEPHTNLLPCDGTVQYYGKVIELKQSNFYYEKLLHTLEWKNDEAIILGKHHITKRKVAWYADEPFSYTYSKITKQALLWSNELKELKQLAEKLTGAKYNSCLANLYHDGSEGMAWHSDSEKALEENGSIASFTFGAERKFSFKHKITGEVISVILEHGSLLEMKGTTQRNWLHRLPPTTKIKDARINLTFRKIIQK
jgi:alkylated DNA repair dioxygenase AlkB